MRLGAGDDEDELGADSRRVGSRVTCNVYLWMRTMYEKNTQLGARTPHKTTLG